MAPKSTIEDDDSRDGWLSTEQAAKRIGITPRTLYRFIDEGDLRAYRFGRVIRIRAADVDAFVERSQIQPGSLRHLYPSSVDDADSTD